MCGLLCGLCLSYLWTRRGTVPSESRLTSSPLGQSPTAVMPSHTPASLLETPFFERHRDGEEIKDVRHETHESGHCRNTKKVGSILDDEQEMCVARIHGRCLMCRCKCMWRPIGRELCSEDKARRGKLLPRHRPCFANACCGIERRS